MTLDCRTLWSVRFFAAKGHFCSLLLSNILVTSAFCRLTISPIFFHSTFPVFSLLSLSAGCSYRLEFHSIDKPPNRSFWNLGIRYLWLLSTTLRPCFFFQKKRWKESFFGRGVFLLWLYIIMGFLFFQEGILYNLSNFCLYITQISVINAYFSLDWKSRLY